MVLASRAVPRAGEASESGPVEPHLEREKGRHEHVDAAVELLPPDRVRPINVPLRHVLLHAASRGGGSSPTRCGSTAARRERAASAPTPTTAPARRGGDSAGAPERDLAELVGEEDALALRAAAWLHDPRGARVLFELFDEEAVVGGEGEGRGDEVELARLGPLVGALQLLAHPLHVLHEQILSRELVVVREVTHALVVLLRRPSDEATSDTDRHANVKSERRAGIQSMQ